MVSLSCSILSLDAHHPLAYVYGGFSTAVKVSTSMQNERSKLSALNASKEVYMEVAWSHVRIRFRGQGGSL